MKTALTELIEDLKEECKSYYESNEVYLKSCIEKEKQQIIDAWENGYNHGACVNEDKDKYHGNQYHKEIFK